MKKRVADILIEELIKSGVTDCFAVVGGGAMHIDNALAIHPEMNKVFCHHEQACAMAAEGYAKASGKPALVSVTSGPGGLNTLNGVQGAYVDNVPMIVVAGHPRWETTVNVTGLDLRCRGVQEFDIIPALSGMTKYAKMVLDQLSIRQEVQRALHIAMEGRRGPVWLSVPLDIQATMVEEADLYPSEETANLPYDVPEKAVNRMNEYIRKAKRPVILSGSGLRTGGEVERFRAWTERMHIPVVSGALLPDIMYEGAPYFYGTSGSIGERRGNFILQNADLIIAIANSLSTKQTGFNQNLFAPNADIIMIDAGADEGKKPGVKADLFLHMDVKRFFDNVADNVRPWEERLEWIDYCKTLPEKLGDIDMYPASSPDSRVPGHLFWNTVREKLDKNALIALGNSSGIVGVLQRAVKYPEQRVIVNYNCGSMGDDLPEATGIAVAGKRDVLCVTGDGSVMLNLQELQTIVHYRLPVKVVILSNEGYAAIRETNKNFFGGVYIGCDKESGISMPDFGKVTAGFGLPFRRCTCVAELDEAVTWLLSQDGAAVLEIYQMQEDPVSPKVMSKQKPDGTFSTPALHEMAPFLPDERMRELMLNETES